MSRRGMTMAEVLIASALSVLLLGLVMWLYLSLQRTWQRGEQRQQAVRDGLIVTSRLREDYRASLPGKASLSQLGNDQLLSFPSYQGAEGTIWDEQGQVLWRKWVQYRYQPATQSLFRRETARTPASAEVSEASPAWPDDAPSHRLSSHLSDFQVQVQHSQLQVNGRVALETSQSPLYLFVYPQLYGLDQQ